MKHAALTFVSILTPCLSLESVFAKLSDKQIQEQKEISRIPLKELPQEVMEIGFENLYADHALIDFPKRPVWSHGDSKIALEKREEVYFQTWIAKIYDTYPASELSYFEHNLQVWRQLWRVVEMCDILLFVVDARHPILHFPPTLYDYVVKEQGKKLVLVFNKV